MLEFISVAERELEAVRQELAALPLFQKYERLSDLISLYKGEPREGLSRFGRIAEPKKIHRPAPERDAVLALARAALENRLTPTKTSEIYDIIVSQGAQIGGVSPKGNLSAMLWKSDIFRSHGRAGWTLTEYGLGDEGDPSAEQIDALAHGQRQLYDEGDDLDKLLG